MFYSYNFEGLVNDPQNSYFFQTGFSQEELDQISRNVEKIPFQTATTLGDDEPINKLRSSRVKWIPQDESWRWLYDKLADMIVTSNNELWRFHLSSIHNLIQYTEYHAEDEGHYTWHQDIGPGEASKRKISITVQLSGADEYEGGDLELWLGGDNVVTAYRGAGSVLIFPSYLMHRVSKVTRGVRKSFVLWVGGSHYI